MLIIRPARSDDADTIWSIAEPIVRKGDTYTLPSDIGQEGVLEYWFAPGNEVFVAEDEGQVIGTYCLRINRMGPGSHVANCGYMTDIHASGKGVGRAMCEHSLARAKERGFRAMQFNFVVSTNDRAVHLWQRCGFEIVGRLPEAFLHPINGYVDAYVMYRLL